MRKIFFVNYLLHRPELPNVSGRYELLSDSYCGDMVAICPNGGKEIMLGNFHFHSIPYIKNNIIHHIGFIYYVLKYGLRSQKKKKINIIVTYDPLLCGLSGYILKILTGAKLVVEVNGDIINAGFLNKITILSKIKKIIITTLTKFILNRSDRIKYVNSEIENNYSKLTTNYNNNVFPNFVPTYMFQKMPRRFDKFILFIGFPFHLKGVDILIKAFKMISHKYENFTLKIIGHCPDPTPYYKIIGDNNNIIIKKAVHYNKIISEFNNCYCFVLPSRTEGMPRVLIEAMSSGKPVIGSNVGGIPNSIKDGINGFLFEKENVNCLADKLDILLGDKDLTKEMGDNAYSYVQNNLSAQIYIEKYKQFLDNLF